VDQRSQLINLPAGLFGNSCYLFWPWNRVQVIGHKHVGIQERRIALGGERACGVPGGVATEIGCAGDDEQRHALGRWQLSQEGPEALGRPRSIWAPTKHGQGRPLPARRSPPVLHPAARSPHRRRIAPRRLVRTDARPVAEPPRPCCLCR